MKHTNKPTSARDLLARLAQSLATLARCAEQIARHVPNAPLTRDPDAPPIGSGDPGQEKPRRGRGRPAVFKTKAARKLALRAHCRNSRRRSRAAAKGLPVPEIVRLRTPETMPPTARRAGACAALGLRVGEIMRACDMTRARANNALHRFRAMAGIIKTSEAARWFDAHQADPKAYAPNAGRLAWATESARAEARANRCKAMREAWRRRRASASMTD